MTTSERSLALLGLIVAMEAGAATAAEAPPSFGIETVVVTAERKEEALQTVPLSITALSAQQLQDAGINSTAKLQTLMPGLLMTNAQGASLPFIRGVGTSTGGVASEAAVSTYVDGVYIGPVIGGFFDFNNVERVEVLRGPQGTLFGRNATGGLIQIVTSTPTQDRVSQFGVAYESYQTVVANAYMSGGLTSDVAADISLHVSDQNKGYGENLYLGNQINYKKEYAGRTKLVYTPTSALTMTLSADYDSQNNDIGIGRGIMSGTVAVGGTTAKGTIWDIQSNVPRSASTSQGGASAKVAYDFGSFTVSSLTALRRYTIKNLFDQDSTPLNAVNGKYDDYEETVQQEFLAQGESGKFDWTAGLFFYNDLARNRTTLTGASASLNYYVDDRISKKSWAPFAQGSYEILENTKLTVGVRYTEEKQKIDGTTTAVAGNANPVGTLISETAGDLTHNESKLTWRVSLDHQITDDLMVYAFGARGFKTGGFNIFNYGQAPINPEVLTDIEGGVKANLFNDLVRLDIGGFRYKYKDMQVVVSQPGGSRTLNAAAATLYGVDAQADMVVPVSFGDLRMSAAGEYLHAVYDTFKNSPYFIPAPASCTPFPYITGPATGGDVTCVADVSGYTRDRAPKFTGSLSVDYSFPLEDGKISLHSDVYRTASFFWQPDNRLIQPAYTLLNAQISYRTSDGITFRVYGSNLTSAEYYVRGYASSYGDTANPGIPRIFGVGIDYTY